MALIHKIEKILLLFLWGKNHKVKKTVIINKCVNGGLDYTDVESKICALKAAWIPKVKNYDVLNDIVHLYLSKIGLDLNTVTVVLGDTSILLLNQHIKTHKVPKDVY